MKIRYEFVNGEVSEIEVDEGLGELLVDFDREQYNNDHKETRRHVSLDGMDYEGELFASAEDTEGELLRREDTARLMEAMEALSPSQRDFRQGLAWSVEMFGYRQKNSRLEIVPEEAELLRMAAKMYLDGANPLDLERAFAEAGAVGRRGGRLTGDHIVKLLCNEKIAGDMVLQKTFVDDPIAKNNRKNTGERPQYYVEGSHKAILDRETYEKVLEEYARWKAEGPRRHGDYPFCSRIVCGKCGGKYVHRLRGDAPYAWLCSTYNKKGKAVCDARIIQERVLEPITAEVMGLPEFDGAVFRAKIKEIQVQDNCILSFVFFDGRIIERSWENLDCRYGRRAKSCQQ